jgi:3-oxoacyl-[acyl-carrier protein] reductase
MLTVNFKGKRALITGGSRGVGRATALMLAHAGADVGISYQSRHADAEKTVADLKALGVRAFAHPGDLADPANSERLCERMVSEVGGIDFFIANAGIWPVEYADVSRMRVDQWRRTLAANLDAVFYSTRAVARVMGDGGRIVYVGSTAGQRGEAGHVDYAATKGALIAMVKGLCIELAPRDINVNCIAPGWIDTEMTVEPYQGGGREKIEAGIPLGRVASAEDIAGPIVFLCSPLARHITGEVLNINGGSVLAG